MCKGNYLKSNLKIFLKQYWHLSICDYLKNAHLESGANAEFVIFLAVQDSSIDDIVTD